MDFSIATWRKLYVPESLDHQAMPFFARCLRDHLIKAASDDGTLLARTSDPGPDLSSALRLKPEETKMVCEFLVLLIDDGYLTYRKKRLFITRFEDGQERRGPLTPAQRQKKSRDKRAKALEATSDDQGDGLSRDCHVVSQGSERSDPNDPNDPNEQPDPGVTRDDTRDGDVTEQLSLEPSSQKPKTENKKEQVRMVFDHWKSDTNHLRAILDSKRENRIRDRLKDFTVEQLCKAISNRKHDDWLMGRGDSPRVFDGIETLLRDVSQVEKLLDMKAPAPTGTGDDRPYEVLGGS